jgi:UDP:flavonoid glycosyltransferase YjiC (YdhE family)
VAYRTIVGGGKSVRRATIVSTGGTMGDVAYLASIAQELQRIGIDVRMLMPKAYVERMRATLEAAGLRNLCSVDPSSPGVHESAPVDPAVHRERKTRKHLDTLAACVRLCSEATTGDVIIGDASCALKLPLLACAAAVPYFQISPMPYIPTHDFYMGSRAPVLAPRINLARWKRFMKRWSRVATRGIADIISHDPALAREWRSAVGRRGLSARRWDRFYRHELAHIVCASPHMVPRPRDWTDNVTCVPYCAWDTSILPVDPALAAFVDAGPPPVYVGFGSFGPLRFRGERGSELLRAIAETAKTRGVRLVVSLGADAGRLPDVPENTFAVHVVPHRWLFPRCQAVVCHGGYGTVHTALVSGTPLVVYPYHTDQFFIAFQIERLEVGAPYRTLYKDFTSADFGRDLDWLARNDGVRARVRCLGDLIAREGGARVLVAALLATLDA